MIRVYIFCEGQTEETFVKDVLYDYFINKGIFVYPILVKTSKYGRGGMSTYAKVKRQVEIKCKEDSSSYVTTMFDYYAFPEDCPGYVESKSLDMPIKIAEFLNKKVEEDINKKNFISNFMVHEFEALLFSNPDVFGEWIDIDKVNMLKEIKNEFDTPEHINNNVATAPSKRIYGCYDGYDKILHGTLLSQEIGLDKIRSECKVFDRWIKRIEEILVKYNN